MKTYRQFAKEMRFALENTMLEDAGFGKYAKKRRKKKKEYLSPRELKIKKLKNRPLHWSGLEGIE